VGNFVHVIFIIAYIHPTIGRKMTHACYADDTVVFCKSDFRNITALERVLNDFEMASGNEIKRAKSYIIWLGSKRGSTDRIANIPPLIGSERYLGLMIAENFDPDINWKKMLKCD